MADKRFHVTATFSGVAKRLFSLRLRSNDLSVIVSGSPSPKLAHVESLEKLFSLEPDAYENLQNRYITIHTSHGSPRTNVINHHDFVDKQQDRVQRHTSTGIKVEREFIPVTFKVSGDLGSEKNNFQRAPDYQVADINTENDSLVWMLSVGPAGREFEFIEDHPSNLYQFDFGEFRFVFIWSLFNFPALKPTLEFKVLSRDEALALPGLENFDVYNHYTYLKCQYSKAYFNAYPQGYSHNTMS